LSKTRSKADGTEPTASGGVASAEESVVDYLGQFYFLCATEAEQRQRGQLLM